MGEVEQVITKQIKKGNTTMGTRATIGIERDNGKVKFIVAYWDGYLEYTGKMLAEHYMDMDKVSRLVNGGWVESVKETLEDTKRTPQEKVLYESVSTKTVSLKTFLAQDSAYNYLFTKDGKWKVYMWNDGHNKFMWHELKDALAA